MTVKNTVRIAPRGNNTTFRRHVNTEMGKSFAPRRQREPTFGDRLRFVVWLSAYTVGAESGKELAAVLGKGDNSISKWVKEKPRPSWESIKLIADTVGVDAVWLDDPTRSGAREPEQWPQWWEKRKHPHERIRRGA